MRVGTRGSRIILSITDKEAAILQDAVEDYLIDNREEPDDRLAVLSMANCLYDVLLGRG